MKRLTGGFRPVIQVRKQKAKKTPMINTKNITDQVKELARVTGKFILSEWNQLTSENVESKGLHDFVTYVDMESEKKLVDGLKEILPEAGFIVEEETISKKGEVYNWIVDPLDGTTNYIHGITPFAISIALSRNDEIIMGVVYELGFDEMFYAWEGSPAYMNGSEISVSKVRSLEESIIATGFPYNDFTRLNPFLQSLEHFMRSSHGIRRFGSAATDLCYTACGRFEAFYEYSLKPWDVAAGSFIVRQAGGKVSDFSGGNDYLYNQEMVAANPQVFDEFLKNIQTHLKRP